MKRLENLLKITGKLLAVPLSALALYSSAQEPTKIPVEANGTWNNNTEATLYFQSTTGSQGRDLAKSKANQFKTPVYFSGRRNSNGNIELFYATTDWNNPSKNPPVPDNVHSRLYLIANSDIEAEIVSQKIAIMNSRGEVTFEEATPKEKASSTLWKLGVNIVEAADEGVRRYIQLKTAGIVNLGIEEALIDYCENRTKKGASNARNNTGYELSVNNLPLWVRDNNLAFRNREVGRVTEIKIKSSQGEEVPISIYYSITLKREKEQERGTIDAFTELFVTPARKLEPGNFSGNNNPDRSPFEGFWRISERHGKPTEYCEGAYISPEGFFFYLEGRKEGFEINRVGPENKISATRIDPNENKKLFLNRGLITPISANTLNLQYNTSEEANSHRVELTLERVSRVEEKEEITQPKPVEKPTPPKQTTGSSYSIRNWMKR
jgi:hypothetical protein